MTTRSKNIKSNAKEKRTTLQFVRYFAFWNRIFSPFFKNFFHLFNSNCCDPSVTQLAMIIPVICSDQRKSNGWTGMTPGNQTASDGY